MLSWRNEKKYQSVLVEKAIIYFDATARLFLNQTYFMDTLCNHLSEAIPMGTNTIYFRTKIKKKFGNKKSFF